MKRSLNSKSKLGFVDGTLVKPDPIKAPKDHIKWEKCDDLVSSWILHAISPDLVKSVVYHETAREMWVDLEERFSQTNLPKLFQLRKSISDLRQENQSVTDYYGKIKELWDELASHTRKSKCICADRKETIEQEQEDKAIQFLLGLNETYSAIRGHILLSNPLPSVSKIYSLILQEEKQREVGSNNTNPFQESSVFAAGRNTSQNIQTTWHNKSLNQQPNWENRSALNSNQQDNKSNQKEKPICSNCKKIGHSADKCYWLVGFPPKINNYKKNKSNNKEGRAATAETQIADTSITQEQYQQILHILSKKVEGRKDENTCHANTTGPCFEEDDWYG